MECDGLLFAIIIGALINIASRNRPETRCIPPTEQPSGSPLNGLFVLFLLDCWLDGGKHGMLGEVDEPQKTLHDDGDDHRDDSNGDDRSWNDHAGF